LFVSTKETKMSKRPFVTQYFTEPDASGKRPVAMGYAASVKGARRNMAVRIVLGQYGLAIVADRDSREVLSIMRRTKAGLNIKDTPAPVAPVQGWDEVIA
jgi:hypothetical protein